MIRKLLLFPAILTLIMMVCLTGCSKQTPLVEMDDETAFYYLKNLFDKGKFVDASEGFDYFTLNFSGSAFVDSAQSLLGRSHYKLKEYILAADAFEELYRRFPRSRLVPDAMYMVGECYWKLSPKYSLDQEATEKAIDALQGFIDYYPDYTERVVQAQELIDNCREKLAHKGYANGIIYLKMKDHAAAIIYFQEVVDNYYDTEWAPLAVYQLGVSLVRDKQFEEAESAYRAFIAKYPEHSWRIKAETALRNLMLKSEE